MFVVTLEYWPGADPARRQRRGWAAVVREHRHGRHVWVVVVTLEGHRHSWSGPASGTAMSALVTALVASGAVTAVAAQPAAGASRIEAGRLVHEVTAIIEADLAGVVPEKAHGLGAGPASLPQPPAQRAGARQRVLSLPMLTEDQVQNLFDGERDHPAIVRGLRKAGVIIGLRHQGRRLYPGFQFMGARPRPLVAAVNIAVAADRDPWRAAIWWTISSPALGTRPLDLLDRPHEHDRLLNAAHVESRRNDV